MLQIENNNKCQKDTLYETVCQVKEMLETDRSITDIKQYLKFITGKDHQVSEIYALAYCYDFMNQIKIQQVETKMVRERTALYRIVYNSLSKELDYQDTHCIRKVSFPVNVTAVSLLTGEEFDMTLESEDDAKDLMVDEFDLYIKQ